MASSEEKAIKLKLRGNRSERLKLKERREQLKSDTIRLREERKSLLSRASELGIQFGKQANVA